MTVSVEVFAKALKQALDGLGNRGVISEPAEDWASDVVEADIAAHLTLTTPVGDQVVMLTASNAAACAVVRGVARIDASRDEALRADAIGELLNVVVGKAQQGGGYQFSIPTIAINARHRLRAGRNRGCRLVVSTLDGEKLGLYLIDGNVGEEKSQ